MDKLIQETAKSPMMRWTDRRSPWIQNFLATLVPSLIALLSGGIIDNIFEKIQDGSQTRVSCIKFFSLQLLTNIFLLIFFLRKFVWFITWMQLTISGIIFAVLFFAVQNTLSDNALCAVKF
jgi:hypothetical protein